MATTQAHTQNWLPTPPPPTIIKVKWGRDVTLWSLSMAGDTDRRDRRAWRREEEAWVTFKRLREADLFTGAGEVICALMERRHRATDSVIIMWWDSPVTLPNVSDLTEFSSVSDDRVYFSLAWSTWQDDQKASLIIGHWCLVCPSL